MSWQTHGKLSRRVFLKGLGVTTGAGLLTPILQACGSSAGQPTAPAATNAQPTASAKPTTAPAANPTGTVKPTAAANPAKELKGELSFWASGYTPGVTTGNVPVPLKQFQNIANDYQKEHPGVKINFINNPLTGDQVRPWLITQLTGGTAPHLCWSQPNWRNEDVEKKWWVAWDGFLDKPNPYMSGNARWRDMFYVIPDMWRNVDGKLYTLLGDQTQVVFWYNKDIFQKAGVNEPTNWKEMMDLCQKIKALGVDPFAWMGADLNQITWTSGWVKNFILYGLTSKVDLGKDGVVDKLDVAKAIKEGLIDYTKPEINEEIKILQEMAHYFPKGFNGGTSETVRNSFFQQKAAIYMWTVGLFPVIIENPVRKFDFGAFYFPPIDQATTQYADAKAPMTNKGYGYGSFNYGITNTAVKADLVDLAVDFMMYSTVPERIGPLIAEARTTMPNIKGASGVPELKQFEKTLGYAIPPWQEDDVWLDLQYGEAYLKIMQPWLEGSANLQTTVQAMNKELQAAADRVIAQANKVNAS